jgi:TetR/AcrR family transcriptional regulator, transcriptional repressor for nem operon
MAGRRSYSEADLAVAAKEVFWERGYRGTAIDDLQKATGLSRSSLYLAFGTKRAVFDAALAEYVKSFIDPRLRQVEAPDAGLREAAAFFSELADYFGRPVAARGCLLINATAELAGRDPNFTPVAAEFANRLRAAFSNALGHAADEGAMERVQVPRRAAMLAVAVIGVWLAVRSDAAAAVSICRSIDQEITSWGAPPARA